MKYELIKTKYYLLIVSDEEIKTNDWFYSIPRMTYHRAIGLTADTIIDHTYEGRQSVEITKVDCKKIIAHLPLPIKNDAYSQPLTYLDGVDVLPEIEDEDEKLSYERFGKSFHHANSRYCYREGYNKAKETYKYTEEDMKYMFDCGRNYQNNAEITFKMSIEYLQQPKLPIAFESEIDNILSYNADDGIDALVNQNFGKPKTIINYDGRTEWVGNYLFKD